MKLKTQILEIPEAERTKPYGEILRFKKRFDTKDVKEFNYFLKEWVVTHEVKTEQHYRDGEIVDVQLFSDGSTVEDMTVLEKN